MKKCELCNSVARMYCDSDQAVLCWECDGRVHSANFLVAKHTRALLCQVCQSLTPWTGSGAQLGPTVSVCDICICRRENPSRVVDRDDDDENGEDNDDDDDDDDDDECEGDEGDDDDGQNQVVPLCFSPLCSSAATTSEESLGGGNRGKQRDPNQSFEFSSFLTAQTSKKRI